MSYGKLTRFCWSQTAVFWALLVWGDVLLTEQAASAPQFIADQASRRIASAEWWRHIDRHVKYGRHDLNGKTPHNRYGCGYWRYFERDALVFAARYTGLRFGKRFATRD
jgi:hypothetical protein